MSENSGMGRRAFLESAGAAGLASLTDSARAAQAGPWKGGKKWVYSITYDEGAQGLLKHAVPLHRKYGVPGHVCLVSSQIGVPRNVPGSSYHGMMVLNRGDIQGLAKEGWGFSSHSMTHASTSFENGQVEVADARKVLEDAIGLPVTVFCVPGSNQGHPASLHFAPLGGYKAIMTIYDWVNTKATDLMWLGRCPIHTEWPGPFFSKFDPYKRLQQARALGGWIIDYCHCPMPGKPIHPAKDCTSEELEARFQAVKEIGGDAVWLAEPNEVVDFLVNDEESQRLRATPATPESMVLNEEMRALYRQR
ncbi:MAG: polysaccharide deacetylase family protein [Candidatus Hydrogenedentes bacterium]|nr:polysaccharide deacetylase family protein [Candidatus Hydrogenedentota bacterium]